MKNIHGIKYKNFTYTDITLEVIILSDIVEHTLPVAMLNILVKASRTVNTSQNNAAIIVMKLQIFSFSYSAATSLNQKAPLQYTDNTLIKRTNHIN